MKKFDFSGWATKNNIKCSDGRVILKDAFKHNDGQTVPLVWMHDHNDPLNVIGHAILENRSEGVYAYGLFNDTEAGRAAKEAVEHGDIKALSIYANKLQQEGSNVVHGAIREVSLVMAGANPGAFIETVIRHGDAFEDEAYIYTGENISLQHEDQSKGEKDDMGKAKNDEQLEHNKDKTIGEIFDTMTKDQKTVVYALVGQALENDDDTEGGKKMGNVKHNLFEGEENKENVLTHSEMKAIIDDAKRGGSLKDAVIQHGIENIDYLFPEDKNMTDTPIFIQRDMGWVQKVFGGLHKTPFSRIKSLFADITEEDARAKGYIKGNLKKEEVFTLLKRSTSPTTVYKKQKMDRDDVVDITDFDVVTWIKAEMRMMLDEEISRAVLIGDGRLSSSDDKISEEHIRPIWKDEALFTIKAPVVVASNATADQKAKAFIRAAIKARKNYKGSGEPTLYTTEDVLTDCLLMEDLTGRTIYDTVAKLATALRVKEIITVPVMEDQSRTVDGATLSLMGIIVNLIDYNIGADKGGAVNMFDDFDIDYNKLKYLIETRCSGALVKPFSAIALELSFQ